MKDNKHLDEIDTAILAARESLFRTKRAPRVGDFIKLLDGTVTRFTHKWDDGIQTDMSLGDSSFHLMENGLVSYSGGLNSAIPNERIALVKTDAELGRFWFFSHDIAKAYNGVNVWIKCDLFKEVE